MELQQDDRPLERPSFLALPASALSSRENDDVFFAECPLDDTGPYGAGCQSERPRRLSSSRSLPCVQERTHDKAGRADSAPSPNQLTGSSCDTPMTDSFPASTPSREDEDGHSRSAFEGILQCERDFFDFVMTLHSEPKPSKPSATKARRDIKPSTKPKVGLDHLDNLCKLMEQLGDLKEENKKLHRRVQYLEDVKNLHEMHKDIDYRRSTSLRRSGTSQCEVPEYLGGYDGLPENRPENHLQKSRTQSSIGSLHTKSRERSRSVGNEQDLSDPKELKSKKFPNWSKMKEALGGKQRPGGCDASRQSAEANHGTRPQGETILNADVRRNIRIPVYTEDYDDLKSVQRDDHCRQEVSWCEWRTGNTLEDTEYQDANQFSSESDPKDRLRPSQPVRRRSSPGSPAAAKERFKDDARPEPYSLTLHPSAYATFARCHLKDDAKKPHKSPWGRVKTLIQTKRESVKKRQRIKGLEDVKDSRVDSDPCSYAAFSDFEEDVALRSRDTRSRRRKVSDQYVDGGCRRSELCEDFRGFPKERSKSQTHIHDDYKRDFRGSDTYARRKTKPAPLTLSPSEDVVTGGGHSRTSSGVASDTPRSSPQFNRKSRWNKVKKVFAAKVEKKEGDVGTPSATQYPVSKSVPSSPMSLVAAETAFSYDDLLPYEDEEVTKAREESVDRQRVDSLPLSLCPSSDGELSLFPLSQSATMPISSIVLELQRNLSDDFSQKMLEWERIKSSGGAIATPTTKDHAKDRTKSKSEKLKGERQDKPAKHKLKDVNWLDKELQKIEREKERLSKEKRKYEERSARLQRLRKTLLSSTQNRNEILVRTSAGEFRFEGISDAFTKKLYEWETKQGVVPELSTIALLDASLSGDKGGLPRGLSRSDSSITEQMSSQHQTSHASTSSLPSMIPETGYPQDENLQPSRANSEPDLSSPHGQIRRDSYVSGSQRSHSDDQTWSTGDYGAYVHPDVTWLIDSGSRGVGLGQRDSRLVKSPEPADDDEGDAKPTEDNYYTLLEENMLLLEQLKSKEDICRQMERELKRLDSRLDDANNRHRQEIERYRERLWEAHRPDLLQSGYKESQASLRLLTELKNRVDEMERFGRRCHEDRRVLQDSFRYHSEDQLRLTRELVANLRDLRCSATPSALQDHEEAQRRKSSASLRNWRQIVDVEKLARVQELLAQLLTLAQELEASAAERTQQLWTLRGELLQRDLAQARTRHTGHFSVLKCIMGPAEGRRCSRQLFPSARSFSDGSIVDAKAQMDGNGGLLHDNSVALQDNGSVCSERLCNVPTGQLLETVQQLRTELLAVFRDGTNTDADEFASCIGNGGQSTLECDGAPPSGQSDDPNSGEARLSLASSDSPSHHSGPASADPSVRHNSADNMSNMSGHDGSESSSLNDSERVSYVLRLPRKSWTRTRDTVSTSSDSSYMDDEIFVRAPWYSAKAKNRPDALELTKDTMTGFDSPTRLRDEVFEEPSLASSVEAVFSLPYPLQDSSTTCKFQNVLAEETAEMLTDGEDHVSTGNSAGTEVTITSRQSPCVTLPRRNASTEADTRLCSSSEDLEVCKSPLKCESPMLRSRSTRKLKKAKEAYYENKDLPVKKKVQTEDSQSSLPTLTPPPSPAKDPSMGHPLGSTRKEPHKQESHPEVFPVQPRKSNGSRSSFESTVQECRYSATSSTYIPAEMNRGALSRFEALHRAKTEFFTREGPIVLQTSVPTPTSAPPNQGPTFFSDESSGSAKRALEAQESCDSEEITISQSDAPTTQASQLELVQLRVAPGSSSEKVTPAETARKKSKQEGNQTEKTSFLSLKLRKGKRKDYSTVGELCRQTLTVTISADREAPASGTDPTSPLSPPSPESRAKGINKWLPIFSTKS